MAENPRNQAEALTFLKKREDELLKKLLESETEIMEFLNWANLPMTVKVRDKFKKEKEKCLEQLEAQKWTTEADARGLTYFLRALSIIEKMVESYQKLWNRIQAKKQKES